MRDPILILRECGIQPTPQRIAVVEYILSSDAHSSADEVLAHARKKCPTVSRATVYNTLNLLVDKGLVRPQILREGTVVFDRNIHQHHHFIDEDSGKIYDVPWDALKVTGNDNLKEFDIREYHVVLRGRRRRR